MFGWLVCFGVGAGILFLLLRTYTESNLMRMREQQERNERELMENMRQRERLEEPLLSQAIEEWRRGRRAERTSSPPMTSRSNGERKRDENPKRVIVVRNNGVSRRYSVNEYGEVFEER